MPLPRNAPRHGETGNVHVAKPTLLEQAPAPRAVSEEQPSAPQAVSKEQPQPHPGSEGDLAPGWHEALSPDGQKYYYHIETHETRSDRPTALGPEEDLSMPQDPEENLGQLMTDRLSQMSHRLSIVLGVEFSSATSVPEAVREEDIEEAQQEAAPQEASEEKGDRLQA